MITAREFAKQLGRVKFDFMYVPQERNSLPEWGCRVAMCAPKDIDLVKLALSLRKAGMPPKFGQVRSVWTKQYQTTTLQFADCKYGLQTKFSLTQKRCRTSNAHTFIILDLNQTKVLSSRQT